MTADLALQLLIVVVGLIAALNIDQLIGVDRPRHDADVEGLHLRADGRDGGVHRAWSRRPGWRARSPSAAAGSSGWCPARRSASSSPTPASRSSRSPRCRSWTAGRSSASPEYIERAGRRRGGGAATRTGSRVGLKYVVAALATVTLIAAANSAMLGLSRLAYSLATNRQIPSALGRLHPTRSTPFVVIGIAAVLAGALVAPEDLDFLVGIYAFGALARVHDRAPLDPQAALQRARPHRAPTGCRCRSRSGTARSPLPALLGAIVSACAFVSRRASCTRARATSASAGWRSGS